MDDYFFYNTLKTYITAFGNVFNNVKVLHGNGNERTVPIRYASKEKFVEYLSDQAGLTPPYYEQAVPVLAYEMTEITYDATRKINALKENFYHNQDGNTKRIFAPVPFNLTFNLSIYTRYGQEMLQIAEQILPYFQPTFNITIKEVPELGILERDVPILLTGISTENIYVGSKDERRHIEWTLTFEMRAWLYPNGNVNGQSSYPLINRVIIDFGTNVEAPTYTGIDYMTDPFGITSEVPHEVRKSHTYSEIFSGEVGVPSIYIPPLDAAHQSIIRNSILTITEEMKAAGDESYNYFFADTYNHYCEVDVRFDITTNGTIKLMTHAIGYAGYSATINTVDGSIVISASNSDIDSIELGTLPAGTVVTTDEVRLEAIQISATEDSVILYVNNINLFEGSVPMEYNQTSKGIAIIIGAEVSAPETAVGIKWLRVGSYENSDIPAPPPV